jgi:hypothetical protein
MATAAIIEMRMRIRAPVNKKPDLAEIQIQNAVSFTREDSEL